MNKIIFIADFFANEISGGGELNNEELINIFLQKGLEVQKINSRDCTLDIVKNNQKNIFIVANFVQLHNSCIKFMQEKCRYIIYEHDHKYLKTRNPADYVNYLAPSSDIVYKDFYSKAIAVLSQSIFHKNIILKNLKDVNVINLSGNLWSEDILETLRIFNKKEKKDFCAIMNTNNWHKNTSGAIKFCNDKKYNIDLIEQCDYKLFLERLSNNKKLVFFPKTTETLSRIVVECRMMGMSVITNEKVGATYEDWFKLKGEDLIEEMKNRRVTIPKIIEEYI